MLFDKVHHICIVVRDMERSVAAYETMGIGPWADFPALSIFTKAEVPDGFFNLRYRYAFMGEVQLQLCQPGPENTPQRRFLEEKGEGVYHIGFDVENIDTASREGQDRGLTVLSWGRRDNGAGFTYFDTRETAGVVLEVRSSNPVSS